MRWPPVASSQPPQAQQACNGLYRWYNCTVQFEVQYIVLYNSSASRARAGSVIVRSPGVSAVSLPVTLVQVMETIKFHRTFLKCGHHFSMPLDAPQPCCPPFFHLHSTPSKADSRLIQIGGVEKHRVKTFNRVRGSVGRRSQTSMGCAHYYCKLSFRWCFGDSGCSWKYQL